LAYDEFFKINPDYHNRGLFRMFGNTDTLSIGVLRVFPNVPNK